MGHESTYFVISFPQIGIIGRLMWWSWKKLCLCCFYVKQDSLSLFFYRFFPSYPGLGVTIMQLKYISSVLSRSQTTRFQKRQSRCCFELFILFVSRRRMDCPQWTAMSQHPASLPTTLPPKCHPTWGTAPPPRPMWPDPRGSRPVAVLYLPTAVISPPL